MADLFNLTGPGFGPLAGGAARQLIILLHGWGADGNDLIGLAPHWARSLPAAEFLSPHAPFPCETGYGRQWFSIADRSAERILAGVRAVAPIVEAYVDEQLAARGLDDRALAFVGFSQGTMTALHVALRRAKPCAAVLGYSGRLLGEDMLADELRSRPPVLLIHGTADEVLPVQAMRQAKTKLEALGIQVEAYERPGLGHGIDEFGLETGRRFLEKGFAAAATAAAS
jgi:phospholipase/carboxylesterase